MSPLRLVAVPRRVPASRSTPPARLLLPDRLRVALPVLISRPLPLMLPPRARFCAPSTLRSAPRLIWLFTVRLWLASRLEAPVTFKVPLPSAAVLPSSSPPAFSVVPPL